MWSSNRQVAPGELVIVWMTRDNVQPLIVTPGKDFNSKYGNYRQADFVGVPYGSKVASRTGKGFIYLLRPTPELWTLALPHRTQILYLADIAFIVSRLNIRRGSRVIEAGTGSGSFTHSVARTIGESGHLWSYEFHEARANKAREEFTRHGMTNIVTLTHRNVCKEGFTILDTVDSVFLDLPAPWDAVEHAKKALRKDRITRICSFSPCMEQVLRTVSSLNEAGFTEITMYETLLRPHEVTQITRPQSIQEVSERLKEAEKRREEKRLRQIANNKARLAVTSAGAGAGAVEGAEGVGVPTKRKRTSEETQGADLIPNPKDSSPDTKRVKTSKAEVEAAPNPPPPPPPPPLPVLSASTSTLMNIITPESKSLPVVVDEPQSLIELAAADDTPSINPTNHDSDSSRMNVSNALADVRGHTSYLTFAVLIPYSAPAPAEGEETTGTDVLAASPSDPLPNSSTSNPTPTSL